MLVLLYFRQLFLLSLHEGESLHDFAERLPEVLFFPVHKYVLLTLELCSVFLLHHLRPFLLQVLRDQLQLMDLLGLKVCVILYGLRTSLVAFYFLLKLIELYADQLATLRITNHGHLRRLFIQKL